MNYLLCNDVSIARNADAKYCASPPFHPSIEYPEYPFRGKGALCDRNDAYDLVRQALYLHGLDTTAFGKPEWNPFGKLVSPGDRVVLKPNFVFHRNKSGEDIYAVVTHPSVIRAIADYVYIALRGEGEIIIADAPQADCDFQQLRELCKVDSIAEYYASHARCYLGVYDLRKLQHVPNSDGFLDSQSRRFLAGDPNGYRIVDVGNESELSKLPNLSRVYGADYNRSVTTVHHSPTTNEYCISESILSANVVISMPKMKVHCKVGVTINLKNLVGINGDKNYLPHYRVGPPSMGGDEFPDSLRATEKAVLLSQRMLIDKLLVRNSAAGDRLYRIVKGTYKLLGTKLGFRVNHDVLRTGDWYGNDTAWRMVIDLNRILMYADREGRMRDVLQRKFFSVVDGIMAGEKEGPLSPSAKHCGTIVCGWNPVTVDYVATRLMGLDPMRIRMIRDALENSAYPLFFGSTSDIRVNSNLEAYRSVANGSGENLGFVPPRGWIGNV
jgi:uncharacterized protein (DUF362 family)